MASFFGWFFFAPLYMQRVLGFDSLQTGIGFLPAMIILGAMSLGIAAKIVGRFGPKRSVIAGLVLIVAGLALFVRTPVGGDYLVDVLPAMLILALGGGVSFLPLILIAVAHASPRDSRLLAGLVRTSPLVGGAIGPALPASGAAAGP